MERYINVNDITLKGVGVFDENLDLLIPLSDVRKALQLAPTADVVPRREGKWKPYKDYFTHRQIGWICTNCSAVIRDLSNGDTDYCPHCGAVMETESEEEDE